MAELRFSCVGAQPDRFAATPTIVARLRIEEATGVGVHAALLRCQLRVEPRRRRYAEEEARHLHDLFGDVSRWGDTLKPIQLTTVTISVPGFTGSVDVDLPVPFSYDLDVAAARYVRALTDGEIPLLLLFSGTLFLDAPQGYRVEQVPWSAEISYGLPVSVWQEAVDRFFPHSAWLRLDLDTLNALQRYKTARALPTWDAVLLALLADQNAVLPAPRESS